MCGIAGALDLGFGPEALHRVDAMAACLHHRGPDEGGVFHGDRVALGSRRLSIIDIAGSHQPMSNEDETIWVVFNGQIYNYVELRSELEPTHEFRTNGDTETLLHLYEEHGTNFVDRLRGMFAFAIWDTRSRTLLLARDRFGKKPLYYTRLGGTPGTLDRFSFASELKALVNHAGIETSIDLTAIYQYLCFGFVPHPRTAYAEIAALPPGHWLKIDEDGQQTLQRYWHLPASGTFSGSRADAIERTRAVFDESVRIRLRSDVPVGVFLSGGIDSGLVTASAASAASQPLRSFSVGFADQQFDERSLARLVAERYETDHTEIVVDLAAEVRHPEQLLTRLVETYDQPFADSSAIPSMAVAAEASKHLKVVLNGDGGDEAFAGYRRYSAALLVDRLSRVGPRVSALARHAPTPRQRRGPVAFTLRLLEGLALTPRDRYIRWTALFSDDEAAELFQPEFLSGIVENARALVDDRFDSCLAWGMKESGALMMAVDSSHILADDLLIKMDMATMANSLEGRSPFLDHELVELATSLPDRLRVSPYKTKPLLRQIAEERLPKAVVEAPKRGFEVPMASWLRNELRDILKQALLASDARIGTIVRPTIVRRLIDQHLSGERDHGMRLWALLNLEWWLRSDRAPTRS